MVEKNHYALFFYKINGYIKDYDRIKYLTLISYGEKYEKKLK